MHYRSLITFLNYPCTNGLTADRMLCTWFLSLITCFAWICLGIPSAYFCFGMGERLITQYCKKPAGQCSKVDTSCKQNYEEHLLSIWITTDIWLYGLQDQTFLDISSNSTNSHSQFFKCMLIKLKTFVTLTLFLIIGPVHHQQRSRRSHGLGHWHWWFP